MTQANVGDDPERRFVLTLCSAGDADADLAVLCGMAGGQARGDARALDTVTRRLEIECTPAAAWSLLGRLREQLVDADICLRPHDAPACRLLICDMDMTIVDAETLDEVAGSLGLGEQVAAITARAMRGELDFDAALRERIAMLAGAPERAFHEVAATLVLSPGAERLLAGAKVAGVHTILVSGGFEQVARPVAGRLGFDEVYCNRLDVEEGRLTGAVSGPIVNAARKRAILEQRAREHGITLAECCAIGDGANDLPMIQAAGLGIGYRPKPVLRAATSCHIDHSALDSALHFMHLI